MPPLVRTVLPLMSVLSSSLMQARNMKGLQMPARVLCLLLAVCWFPGGSSHVGQTLPSSLEKLWEEIGSVKTMMAGISGELSRFNTLYLEKLEHRMVSMATALSSVDSNVKNLQERAHVWDTFQLHVAAWNDQIKTLDKKVDILSRGHEKMELIDGKLSSLLNLDYKMERVVGKIEEADNKLSVIGRYMENHRDSPLFGDVATRGVVSTLRIIERKLDRLHLGFNQLNNNVNNGKVQNTGRSSNGKSSSRREEVLTSTDGDETSATAQSAGKGKLIIRCNAPVVVEELLRDVASKVDVIFDKMSAGQEKEAVEQTEDNGNRPHTNELRELNENKLLDRLWKRLTSPYKKTARALEALENTVRAAVNASSAVWDDQVAVSDQILACCMDSGKRGRDTDEFLRRIQGAVLNTSTCDDRWDDRLNRLQAACSAKKESNPRSSGWTERVQTKNPGTADLEDDDGDDDIWKDVRTDNKTGVAADNGNENDDGGSGDSDLDGSEDVEPPFIPVVVSARNCEDLLNTAYARESHTYKLGQSELNKAGRDYYERSCDMNTSGGGWTVIQRRSDFPEPQQNFTTSWNTYKQGFGDLDKEFWFGNEYIHRLTNQKDMILRIDLEAFNGKKAWAEYSTFRVDPADNLYKITVNGYTGNATDSFSAHNGAFFSTVDRNNDNAPACCPCARSYGGGWWFYSCFEANLNAVYYRPGQHREEFRGLIWEYWLGDNSLKTTEMKIRPRVLPSVPGRDDPGFEDHGTSSTEDVDPLDIPEDP